MAMEAGDALRRAGELFGIQEAYWDIWGREHHAPESVIRSILAAMGIEPESAEAIALAEQAALVPVCTVSSAREPWIPVRRLGPVQITVHCEDGTTRLLESEGGKAMLPPDIAYGYHALTALSPDGAVAHGHLVHCPDRVYSSLPENSRLAGIAISLYGLRSDRNWGCGDFTDLKRFCAWAKEEAGAAFVALNPLHAIANRSPYNTSPYLPSSTFYRNFLYLDIEAVPEFRSSKLAQKLRLRCEEQIRKLRRAEFVDYEGVCKLKRLFLQVLYREFLRGGAERRRAFDAYRRKEGMLLERFAVYSALDQRIHRRNPKIWIWPDWPEEFRSPASKSVKEFAAREWKRVEFWQYVYWLVDEQVRLAQESAIAAGMPIGLYHDLALATDRCGSDLWGHRDFFVHGCRVGSPPDDFAPNGQDWSFPPPNAVRHRADGYRLFGAAIRNNARHGGALRIDHVMRFFRLYWIPENCDATQGTFVRERWKELLRVVALESHRNQVMVIGEDLGTVEQYVREGLAEFGVLSYRLLYFEKKEEGKFKQPDEYPLNAVVSSTTHDLPTLAGYWLGRDIEARREAGLLPDDESYRAQLRARLEDKHKMIEIFDGLGLLPPGYPRDAAKSVELTGELHNAAIGFLALANSRLFVLNQEDLTKETEQQNLPGSTWQYPNWKRKMRYSLEELETDAHVHDFTVMLTNWLERSGRNG